MKTKARCQVGNKAMKIKLTNMLRGRKERKQRKNRHATTQQSHCRAYTLRKPELKETRVPRCSSQHYLQLPGHGINLDIHWQTNG